MILGLIRLFARIDMAEWPRQVIYGVVGPVILWLIFPGATAGTGGGERMLGAVLLAQMLIVMAHLSSAIAWDRFTGRLSLLVIGGVSRTAYFVARTCEGVLLSIIPLIVLGLMVLLGVVSAPQTRTWIVFLSGLGFVLWLCAVGIWLGGSSQSASTANLGANMIVGICFAFCPLLYGPERVPRYLARFVEILPPTLAIKGQRNLWSGLRLGWSPAILLFVWVVVTASVASRKFRWTDA